MANPDISKLVFEDLAEREDTANILVYGESGVGKTVFASTAPRPMLWLESEGGTMSIADRTGIKTVKVTGLETYRQVLYYLMTQEHDFKTVVLDSISDTSATLLREIMKGVTAEDDERDEFSPEWGEWGKLTGVMREIIRGYRDLPMNVVFTALTREDTDKLTGKVKVRPRLTPTLADEIPAFMDGVVFMYATTNKGAEVSEEEAEVTRYGLLKPTGKYVAKVRAPAGKKVPQHIEAPTFPMLADIMGVQKAAKAKK